MLKQKITLAVLVLFFIISCSSKKELTKTTGSEKTKTEATEKTDTKENVLVEIDSTGAETTKATIIKYDTEKTPDVTGKYPVKEIAIYKTVKTAKKTEAKQSEKKEQTIKEEQNTAKIKSEETKIAQIKRNHPGTKAIIITTILLTIAAFLFYIFKRPGSTIALKIGKIATRLLGLIAGLFKTK